MKKVVVSFVGSLALASVSMAMAGGMTTEATDNHTSSHIAGVFFDADIGIGIPDVKKSNYTNPATGASATGFSHYGFAWNLDLGYQFNKYFALEGGYIFFGKSQASVSGTPAVIKNYFGGFNADAKGILPVNNALSLFAKAGAVNMHDQAKGLVSGYPYVGPAHGSTWMPLAGLGASYRLNSNVAVTLQDDYAFRTNFKQNGMNQAMPAANDVLAGVNYKFIL